MNKPRLFEFLATCDPSALLNLLSAAYDAMDHDQRRAVFGRLAKAQSPAPVDGEALLDEVEEFRSWMIPGDEKQAIAAYMASLAVIATPDEFTNAALPLIQRDSLQSFTTHAYAAAIRAAREAQRTHLETEIQRQQVRTR